MRGFILLLCLSVVYMTVQAQDITVSTLRKETGRSIKKEADTSTWRWKRGGLLSLNLAQGSLSNWAAGGDDFSMSINAYVNYYIFHRHKKHTWDNSFDLNFGYIQSTSLGSRKNDDRFDYLSKYGYDINNKWYVTGLFNFRSQFFDGYTGAGSNASFSSTFLSPAYILLSAGFDYKPNQKFSMFISPLTSRWVIVANKFLSEKGSYGVPIGKNSINELGAFVSINYNNLIAKNVTYRSRLDMFSNYKNKPQNIDVYMTNLFSCKINKYLSATYALDVVYDDDVRIFGPNKNAARTQLKSLIGIGFMMPFKPAKKV